MIQITDAEMWTFNTLNNHVASVQAELQRAIAARDDYLRKLELTYNARFDAKTGKFYPVDRAKEVTQAEAKPKQKGAKK